MSNNINFNYDANDINYNINKAERAQHDVGLRLALSQGPQGTDTSKLDKDVLLSPSVSQSESKAPSKTEGLLQSPRLPSPTKGFGGIPDEKQEGLIALMGEVLALQAKTQSLTWSVLWSQASESMMMQVEFAPIIAQAVQSNWTAQANATSAQATQSHQDMISNFCMFGINMALGALQAGMDTENPFKTKGDASIAEDAANGEEAASGAAGAAPNATQTADLEAETEAQDAITQNKQQGATRAQAVKEYLMTNGKNGLKFMNLALGKSLAASQLSGPLGQAFMNLHDSKGKTIQAYWQGVAGQSEALDKEAEAYAQFYGQSFNRTDELRQAAQQSIDYAMNILQTAANTITSTVTSMFRG